MMVVERYLPSITVAKVFEYDFLGSKAANIRKRRFIIRMRGGLVHTDIYHIVVHIGHTAGYVVAVFAAGY